MTHGAPHGPHQDKHPGVAVREPKSASAPLHPHPTTDDGKANDIFHTSTPEQAPGTSRPSGTHRTPNGILKKSP